VESSDDDLSEDAALPQPQRLVFRLGMTQAECWRHFGEAGKTQTQQAQQALGGQSSNLRVETHKRKRVDNPPLCALACGKLTVNDVQDLLNVATAAKDVGLPRADDTTWFKKFHAFIYAQNGTQSNPTQNKTEISPLAKFLRLHFTDGTYDFPKPKPRAASGAVKLTSGTF
jgi:hypothetical protein